MFVLCCVRQWCTITHTCEQVSHFRVDVARFCDFVWPTFSVLHSLCHFCIPWFCRVGFCSFRTSQEIDDGYRKNVSKTRSSPEMVGDMSRVTLNFDHLLVLIWQRLQTATTTPTTPDATVQPLERHIANNFILCPSVGLETWAQSVYVFTQFLPTRFRAAAAFVP